MLPRNLEASIRTPKFWDEYFFVDEEADQLWDPWEVRLPFGAPDGALRLSADPYGYVSLALDVGGTAVEIAWDDLAHWHPHVLRWVELDAIGRQVDAHPGIPLLLLARFAPILTAADAEAALPLIDAAWRHADGQISAQNLLLEIIDFRETGARWQHVLGIGWCLEQNDGGERALYSLRVSGNSLFPWQEWHQLMARITG